MRGGKGLHNAATILLTGDTGGVLMDWERAGSLPGIPP